MEGEEGLWNRSRSIEMLQPVSIEDSSLIDWKVKGQSINYIFLIINLNLFLGIIRNEMKSRLIKLRGTYNQCNYEGDGYRRKKRDIQIQFKYRITEIENISSIPRSKGWLYIYIWSRS